VSDVSDATALIAVQGPVSLDLLRRIPSLRETAAKIAALDFYESLNANVEGREWVVSRTGYTGERGYEIYVPSAAAPKVWDDLLTAGESDGALPIGLAARDTLRFEMAYCLYGHELSESITPLEAGIGWAVKLKKPGFIGQSALAGQKTAGVPRRLVGLEIDGKAIARQGARILVSGTAVGEVTSGNFSPTLKRPLALALVRQPLEEGDWAVEIRGKAWPCRIVPCPFIPARVKGDPRAERTGFI
jgi:aminomethyltransferase